MANIVGQYLDGLRDFRGQYEAYPSKRKSLPRRSRFRPKEMFEAEIDKFVFIRDTIDAWLRSADGRTEDEWRDMLVEFLLLIFPKYIAVLKNVVIEDRYSRPGRVTRRILDLALVDANGNLDVIEIKKPLDDGLLAKTQYRDNFVPTKDISGTIMQAEKYLLHLSKWASPAR